jgi:hypothetical protein
VAADVSAVDEPVVPVVPPTARRWVLARWVLVVWWAAVAVGAVVVGEQQATSDELLRAVGAGDVRSVTVHGGGLADAESGYATQEAVWRDGWVVRRTEVVHVRGGDTDVDMAREVVDTDLGTLVRRADPSVAVLTSDMPVGMGSELVGVAGGPGGAAPLPPLPELTTWTVTGGLADAVAAGWVLHLALLVAGPVPRTGSRWGWFWVLLPPIGTLAHALLGMRRSADVAHPAVGTRPRGLTGGWAFLLMLVITSTAGIR